MLLYIITKKGSIVSNIEKYQFGERGHAKIIKAESLDEALNEFVLSCIDFSEFAYKNNPYSRVLRDEPLGYKKGEKQEDAPEFQYFELIPVFNENKKVKELSIIEFNNWHLKQNNILEYHSENMPISSSRKVESCASISQMSNHIIAASMKLRNIKLQMALERKTSVTNATDQISEMQYQMSAMEKEHEMLQKKMGILKTYAGIGRDIVKIRGGKPSDKLKIDIFQSFKYMKEDIEILTDFKDFDALNLEAFDDFVSENYKELLPSEKCIQAYKVTNQEIKYDNFFTQREMNKQNKLVYLLIRNGDNVYRVFNSYDLHKEHLFLFDEPTEVFGDIAKELIGTAFSSNVEIFTDIKDSYDAKISKTVCQGRYDHGIDSNDWKYCVIPFNYDNKILKKLEEDADEAYYKEVEKRKAYIQKYNLEDELDMYSWRWGMSLGYWRYECNSELMSMRENMELVNAYEVNNYLVIFSILKKSKNTYGYETHIGDIPLNLEPLDDGRALTGYNTYRPACKDNFSGDFNPLTAQPYNYFTLWYDYDMYLEYALDNGRKAVEAKFQEQNFKNFNSVAILQNILDSKNIFKDLPPVDVIFGKGIEVLNFVKDGSNLIESSENYTNIFKKKGQLEKGDEVYVIRHSGYQLVGNTHFRKKIKEEMRFNAPQVILAKVTSIKEDKIKVKGYFDVYSNYNYERGISEGDAKISTEEVASDWLFVDKNITEDEILRVLKNRTFREKEFETKGRALKDILGLKRNNEEYNFKGGVFYERY